MAAAGAASTAAAQPFGALAHEQFTVPELVNIGDWAKQAGFDLLATSDHLRPWQANEGHCGESWVTLAAAGHRTHPAWIGPTVTCPTLRYNPPPQPIPLLTAANGRKSMRLAGQYGDGLITDPRSWKQYKSEWEGGARDAGKNPADMPVLVEQFVVVGDKNEAQQAAQFWRFLPKGSKNITISQARPKFSSWPTTKCHSNK
jgi:alkanesulfonate monooxygenase SsuD/methylene tetrahydromethanopterin reductase-like flavin-dependent oxidoreductase (luciferase family)